MTPFWVMADPFLWLRRRLQLDQKERRYLEWRVTASRSFSSALCPFLGEGSAPKIDHRKKGTLILTSLLEDLGLLTCPNTQVFPPGLQEFKASPKAKDTKATPKAKDRAGFEGGDMGMGRMGQNKATRIWTAGFGLFLTHSQMAPIDLQSLVVPSHPLRFF